MNNRFNVRLSWAFYDWANSAWAAIIITFIFSRYFVDVLMTDKGLGTLYWTWTIGISSLVAALLSPIFGSISDQTQRSKFWLIISTLISPDPGSSLTEIFLPSVTLSLLKADIKAASIADITFSLGRLRSDANCVRATKKSLFMLRSPPLICLQ